ncbi:MAG: 30S ribosomal protein S9 [Candidatus Shapirobacteria bacterium]|nr:30S ribosomal protein S9 [Candidatus Shapirobacteria bacterium]
MEKPKKIKKIKPIKEVKEKVKKTYIFAVGRRKTAVARVKLIRGKGETLVNDKKIAEYFPGEISKNAYSRPFQATETLGKYYAIIKVSGSGQNSQLGAVVHGLSRALDKDDKQSLLLHNKETFHSLLKKEKLLTRDGRQRERRKIGQMGRARKKKQSPKR